jgi:hypothetical protein
MAAISIPSGFPRRVLRHSVVVALAALATAPVAVAHRGDGVFTLAEGSRWHYGDVAMLADGSVVAVAPSAAWRLSPDGALMRIPGLRGSGVAATPDGGVLAIQGAEPDDCLDECPATVRSHRVVRWSPAAGVSVAAGTGVPGFGGDGGPAVSALLDLRPDDDFSSPPSGIVAEADGAFVFVDTANRRVRAVDGAGIIRTLAGDSPSTFRYPLGLAASRDGGYLVLEEGAFADEDDPDRFLSPRLRELRRDGTVRTILVVPGFANDLAELSDGAVVVSETDGSLRTLRPGASTLRPFLRPRDPARTFDFAARSTKGSHVGRDTSGGLLVAGDALTYLPRGPTPWSLAALRDTRTSDRAVTAVIETTQPGTATLELVRRKRVVARVTAPVAAGHSTLRVPGAIREQWYRFRLRFEHGGAPAVRDEVPIHGARRLTTDLARRLLGHFQGQASDEDIFFWLSAECRRFGARRVDCVVTKTGDEQSNHAGVASLTLEPTGIVLRRNYEWAGPGFRRHPGYIGERTVQRLSPGRGGRWAFGP